MTMTKETLDRILELNPLEQFEVDGRKYYALGGRVCTIEAPKQRSFDVASLTAICDYFSRNPDGLDLSNVIVHIVDPRHVHLMSPPSEDWKVRDFFLAAECKPKAYPFGQPLDVESFIVALQTYFVPSDTTAALQKMVSSITDQESIAYDDDGLGQTVTAKSGIARLATVPVPNPVELAPYRTFLEVLQPASAFIFRLSKGTRGPQCVLHEADGGNWQLEAVMDIRSYLQVKLPEGTVILA